MFGSSSGHQQVQASTNPFSLLGHVAVRTAARSGMQNAFLQSAWRHRHVVGRRISLTSAIVALVICAATWKMSSSYLAQRKHDIIATKDFATTRTDTYTHVHPRLRAQGDSAVSKPAPRSSKRRVSRFGRIYVRSSDYWAHETAHWLNLVGFWGMLFTPLLMMERLWARQKSGVARPSPVPQQTVSAVWAGQDRRAQFLRAQVLRDHNLPAQAAPLHTSGQSSQLNQSLFGG